MWTERHLTSQASLLENTLLHSLQKAAGSWLHKSTDLLNDTVIFSTIQNDFLQTVEEQCIKYITEGCTAMVHAATQERT